MKGYNFCRLRSLSSSMKLLHSKEMLRRVASSKDNQIVTSLFTLFTKSYSSSEFNLSRIQPVSMAYTSLKTAHVNNYSASPPIVIMHGLMGSKINWNSLAKQININSGRTVYCVDARNHGESPHTKDFNYLALASDMKYFLKEQSIPKACVIGHSMGGKAAMTLALSEPDCIDKLFVLDISPVSARDKSVSTLLNFVKIMRDANLSDELTITEGRKHVDDLLKSVVKEPGLRAFLLTNLIKRGSSFDWKVNLDAVMENFNAFLMDFPSEHLNKSYGGETHFISGALSQYVRPEDEPDILTMFPKATFSYVEGAGHWLHADKPVEFLKILLPLLK